MFQYKEMTIIARLQPLHDGHLLLILLALAMAEKVNIVIGSSQESRTKDNPLNLEERKQALSIVLDALGIKNRIAHVYDLEDNPSDDVWSDNLEQLVGRSAAILTNNQDAWTDKVLGERGHDICRSGLYDRERLMGADIRRSIREGTNNWADRVPPPTVSFYKSINFEQIVKDTENIV